jgi:hypothetical protein
MTATPSRTATTTTATTTNNNNGGNLITTFDVTAASQMLGSALSSFQGSTTSSSSNTDLLLTAPRTTTRNKPKLAVNVMGTNMMMRNNLFTTTNKTPKHVNFTATNQQSTTANYVAPTPITNHQQSQLPRSTTKFNNVANNNSSDQQLIIDRLIQEKANDREYFETERWAYVEALRDLKRHVNELETDKKNLIDKLNVAEQASIDARRACVRVTAENDALLKVASVKIELDSKVSNLTKDLETAKTMIRHERESNEELKKKLLEMEKVRDELVSKQTSAVANASEERVLKNTISNLRADIEHLKNSNHLVIQQKDAEMKQYGIERDRAIQDVEALKLQLNALQQQFKQEKETVKLQREYFVSRSGNNNNSNVGNNNSGI